MDVMQKERIDVLILDIRMPDMTGIEFARSLNKSPVIIFLTAYSEYAVYTLKKSGGNAAGKSFYARSQILYCFHQAY